jgi:tRNA dimethylallyltransferase
MVERGWVDEVRQLLREGLDPMCPAFQAIGYRQMVDHLRGGTSLASAVEDTVRETRRFAKRQLTWFRKEEDIAWLEAAEMQWLASQALEKCGFSNNSIECSGLGRAHG